MPRRILQGPMTKIQTHHNACQERQAPRDQYSSSIQTILSVPEFNRFNPFYGSRGLYRRSGISPCPEEWQFILLSNTKSPVQRYNYFTYAEARYIL